MSTALADRLRALTPLQRALLARRLDRESPASPARSSASLTAYVVGSDALAPKEVQDFLRARVPDYMVPASVVMLDELPRMPNGKVDRRALPAPTVSGGEGTTAPTAQTPVEQQLLEIWAEVLHMERIEVNDNFFEIGGDSILSIQIISRANRAGIQLKPSQFFDHPTIAALARVATTEATEATPEAIASGEVPLTPIQRWFFDQDLPSPSHWTQALSLDVARTTDGRQLEAALRAAARVHDAFRLRYRKTDAGWTQHLVEDAPIEVAHHTLSPDARASPDEAVKAIWTESQDALDIESGPVFRVDLIDRGPSAPYRLILTAHHLVIDVLSWPTLLGDIELAYARLHDGEDPDLSAPGTPFSRWAEAMATFAETADLDQEKTYWLEQEALAVASLPTGSTGKNTEHFAVTLTHQLDAEATRALSDATSTYGMKVPEMVLTALALALAEWTESPTVRIDLEGHGREDLDGLPNVPQSVGWFTSLYPITLQPASASLREALIHVKETLRGVPNKGIGYGMLRYASTDAGRQRLGAVPAEVLFNYMGQATPPSDSQSPLGGAVELAGSRGADGTRGHLIEINALIEEGALTIRWTYSTARHQQATIEHLASSTRTALDELVHHCQNPDSGAYTPSDFPDVDLSQGDLDALLGDFD